MKAGRDLPEMFADLNFQVRRIKATIGELAEMTQDARNDDLQAQRFKLWELRDQCCRLEVIAQALGRVDVTQEG